MKSSIKRFLSLVMTLVMVISMMPTNYAFATDAEGAVTVIFDNSVAKWPSVFVTYTNLDGVEVSEELSADESGYLYAATVTTNADLIYFGQSAGDKRLETPPADKTIKPNPPAGPAPDAVTYYDNSESQWSEVWVTWLAPAGEGMAMQTVKLYDEGNDLWGGNYWSGTPMLWFGPAANDTTLGIGEDFGNLKPNSVYSYVPASDTITVYLNAGTMEDYGWGCFTLVYDNAGLPMEPQNAFPLYTEDNFLEYDEEGNRIFYYTIPNNAAYGIFSENNIIDGPKTEWLDLSGKDGYTYVLATGEWVEPASEPSEPEGGEGETPDAPAEDVAVSVPDELEGNEVAQELAGNTAVTESGAVQNVPEGAVLSITVGTVETNDGQINKLVFDVKPLDENGQVVQPEAGAPVTFRLPIPASMSGYVKVFHEQDLMGIFAILGGGDAKYIEVSSGSFSTFTVEPAVFDFDFTNATTDEAGEGYTWDQASKTLTLSGAAIAEAVTLPAGSTIVVTAGTENSVTVDGSNAIYSEGAIAITGTGKLTVVSGPAPNYDAANSRAICSKVSITVTGTELVARGECAVAAPSVTITDAKVDLYGYYYGIHAKTTSGTADSVVTLTNVSGKIAGYGYGGINAHSETEDIVVTLDGCHDLELRNEVINDSTSVNFNFAGIRAYTRGGGKDVTVTLVNCENVSISNSTMAILAANNANAANEAAAEVTVLIKDSKEITVSGNSSAYSAIFVNNYGIEEDDTSALVIENSEVTATDPNATALMTSTKSAPSQVTITDSEVTIAAGLVGIRTIATDAKYADTNVINSTIIFDGKPATNYVDESVGTVIADTEYLDENSKVIVEGYITGTITEDMTWKDGDVVDGVTIAGDVTITVSGTVSVAGTIRLSPDAISNVTFKGINGAVLIRDKSFTGQMFYTEGVSGNFQNLTFQDITLDGGAVWTGETDATLGRGTTNSGVKAKGSVLYLVYANATLNKSVLQNHDDSTGEKANAVFLRYYSTITFVDSVVRNNNSVSSYYRGGVITVRQGGTVTTRNSEIYGNKGVKGGFFGTSSTGSYGGVVEAYDSTFHHNYADNGAVFDMQCNSNRGYLLIDGCTFYENTSNRGVIYEHSYSRPVIIRDSVFKDNDSAIWDCHADPVLDLSGKIVIKGDEDYDKFLFETPLVLSGALDEGSSIEMSQASVNKLLTAGYIVTGTADYAVTADDLAKFVLPEGYTLTIADVNGDGIGDVVPFIPTEGNAQVTITLKDSQDAEASATFTAYSDVICLPANPFAHEGLVFAGWTDAEGNAVDKQAFTEAVTLTAQWKLEAPVVKLSREGAVLKATVSNTCEGLTYTYQWYKNDEAIDDATDAAYTMTDANTATYKCVVTVSAAGFESVTGSAKVSASAPAVAVVGEAKYATLKEAVAAANGIDGGATITLLGDVTVAEKLTISKNITITGAFTIHRGTAGTIFEVGKNATLTLDGGVIIDGGNDWTFDSANFYADLNAAKTTSTGALSSYSASEEGGLESTASMITISGTNGAVIMNQATIQNNWGSQLFSVPAGATLTMNDGTLIQDIRGSVAGQIKGAWVMYGGKITGVHGHNTNGCLTDIRGGTFTINGGEICYNTLLGLNNNGSGILAQVYGTSSKLIVNGGNIHDNANFCPGGGWGSAVYLNRGGSFEMNGGTIGGGSSDKCTTIGVNDPSSNVALNAGTINVTEASAGTYDSLLLGNVTIGKDMTISGGDVRFCGTEDNTLVIEGTVNSNMLLRAENVTSTGVVNGNVTISKDSWVGNDGSVTISGGTWNGTFTVDEGASLSITGGTFKNDPTQWLAEGYKVTKLADGTYGVEARKVFEVATKDELKKAVAEAQDGDTIRLTADIDYGTDHLELTEAVTLDLGGKTLTTRARNYGIAMKGGCTVTNGKLNHAGTVAAIKVWDAAAITDLEIDVTGTSASGNTINGIVLQQNCAGVDTIKNVTIHSTAGQGVAVGIETYNCGNATEPVIGSMENVTIDAKTTGMSISAPCGTATNCSIKGGVTGIEIWIKGTYSATLDLEGCTVEGGKQAVYAHDEFSSNPGIVNNGTLKITIDDDTVIKGAPLTLTIARAQNVHIDEKLMVGVAMIGDTFYTTFKDAIAAANAVEGGATVILLEDITLGEMLTISGNVTISGEHTITRADAYTGTFFVVNSGAVLTLDGGLVIDGGNEYVFDADAHKADAMNRVQVAKEDSAKWFTPEEGAPVAAAFMITTTGGTVNLNKVTIQNNYSTGSGIISAGANSTITLTGATITHVASTQGNGVVANVSGANIVVTINEGTLIKGNHVGGNHGLFKVYSGAALVMNGGEISSNTGWNSNGTVVGLWGSMVKTDAEGNSYTVGSSFTMNDGIICSNVGVYGPSNGRNAAIYGHTQHVFVMNGGTICHNTGSYGGLDAPYANGKTEINGGAIVNNVSATGKPNADINATSALVITGGTFTQDVTPWLAPNLGLTLNADGTYGITEDLYAYGDETFQTLAELIEAIKNAPTTYSNETPVVTVLATHKIDETVVIDIDLVLDLDGKTISTVATEEDNYIDVFVIKNGATLTVTGEGTVDARPSNSYAFYVGEKGDEGTAGYLIIENGSFYGNPSVLQVTKGSATVNGGYFEGVEYNGGYDFTLNCLDANYKNGSASIIIKGGKFYKFNPANNAAEGAGTSFLADGYLSEADGDCYTVRVDKDALPAVATITFTNTNSGETVTLRYPSERFNSIQHLIGTNDYADFVLGAEINELLAYAADGVASNIVLTLHEDIALSAPLNFYNKYFQIGVEYAITIDGNGHSITWADGYTGTLLNVQSGVSVTTKDLTIDGENAFTFYNDTTTVADGQSWYTRFVNVGEEDKAVTANVILNAGNLTLGEGTKITGVTIASPSDNGKTANTESGGYYLMYNDDLAIIKSNTGTVTISGAKITGNAGLVLNAVNATTTITGSTIDGNLGAGNKGGIIIANGGTMTINGGSISNNKAMARSATILGVINGAEVSFNTTMENNKQLGVGSNTAGAMIVLEGASRFVMNGGSISNNVGGRAGAIASRWVGGNYGQHADTSIVLNAGTITGNTASDDSWNGASVFLRSPATIGDGMTIEGDIAVNAAPGELAITGGTHKGNLIVTDGLSTVITGGTFSYDPTPWVAEGYTGVKNSSGMWTVEQVIARIIFSAFGGSETSITYPGYADSLQDLVDYYMFCNNANETAIPGWSAGDYTPVLEIYVPLDAADTAALGGASTDGAYVSEQPMTWTVKLAEGVSADAIRAADGYMVVNNSDGTITVKNAVVTIGSVAELIEFSGAVTGNTEYQGMKVAANPDVVVRLTADLDLAGSGFTPIGNGAANAFSGTFDGQNHIISNMTLSCNYYRGVGFFRSLGKGAVVKNVTFVNANIDNGAATGANHFYGVVAGFSNNVTLDNVDVKDSSVTCKYAGAAMVGCLEGATVIKNCDVENFTLTTTSIRGAVYGILGNSASGHTLTTDNNTISNTVFVVNGEVKALPESLGYGEWNSGTDYSKATNVAKIGDTAYATLFDAVAAAKENDTIVLIGDVVRVSTLVVDKNVTIDLNGHTVSATAAVNAAPVIRVLGNVTVKNGTVDGTAGTSCYAFIVGNNETAGTLTIESGTYKGDVSAVSITKGVANIKGGTFEATEYEGAHEFTLNCIDANYKNGTAKFNITGGSFVGFNPEDNAAEGANTNYLKSEYTADEDNGVWTVVPYVEWVKAELLAGNDVTLDRDITITDYSLVNAIPLPSNGNGKYNEAYGNGAVFHIIKPGVELDLNGYSITWDAHDDAYCNARQVSLFMVTSTGVAGETADFTVTDSVGTGKVDIYGMGSGMYVVLTTAKGTIKGGTWTNYPCKTCGATNIFLYPSHGGTLEITGGTFEQKVNDPYLVASFGSSTPTDMNSVGVDYDQTKIIITGGTFVGVNPAEKMKFIDFGNGGAVSNANGCAENYDAVDNGDGTFGVKPILKVTFNDLEMVYGNAIPTLTWTCDYTGTDLVVDPAVINVTGAGEYEITGTAYLSVSKDYAVTVVPGKLTVKGAVAECNGVAYESLAKAIAACTTGNNTVKLLATKCDEDVTITQQAGVNIVIDGCDNTYTGTISVNGSKRSSGAETLTIQNVNFVGDTQWQSSIFAVKKSYVHNLTVENCDFTATGAGEQNVYGIFLHHAYNITLRNVTGSKLFDLVYAQTAVTGLTVERVTVTDSGMGFMLPYGMNLSFKDVTVEASGAGIGIYNYNASTATFENCTITGSTAIWLEQKNATNAYTLIFKGTNTLTGTDGNWLMVKGTDAKFKVVVEDTGLDMTKTTGLVARNGNVYYNTLAYAVGDAKDGDTVTVLTDLAVSKTVEVDEDITIDLGGKTVSAGDSVVNMPVFRVLGNVTVTNGTVDGTTGTNSYAFIVGNAETAGTLNIADGTYIGVTSAVSITNGTANISGGIFKTGHDGEGTDYGAQYLLNCMDDAYNAGTAKYVITGGTFYGFNPENNTAEGENTNYLTNAYTAVSIENGAAWTIATAVARNLQTGVGYTSVADGLAQAKSGETVQMLAADSYTGYLVITNGVTLDLNGNTLTTTGVAAFGQIEDSAAEVGGIKVAQNAAMLMNNTQMPLYDVDEGTYRFFEYSVTSKKPRQQAENSITFGFSIVFTNKEAYELLKKYGTDTGMNVSLSLTWTNATDGNALSYIYKSETVAGFANTTLESSTGTVAVLTFKVNGIDTVAGQTLTCTLTAEGNGTSGSVSRTYDVPEE